MTFLGGREGSTTHPCQENMYMVLKQEMGVPMNFVQPINFVHSNSALLQPLIAHTVHFENLPCAMTGTCPRPVTVIGCSSNTPL